jgi:NAD(P)-dependent dehydrogenase (short-subunit alcohol dehydrogenase family)
MSKLSQTMVETLVYGGFNVLSCVGELVAASGTQQSDLVVVLTSSVAALSGQRGQLLYAAGHSAVEGMVVPAARELGKFGVRVVALRAGAFDTRMFRALREEVKRRVLSDSGMVAPLKPRDFARTVAWVMETRAVNGCVIPVDGGMRL